MGRSRALASRAVELFRRKLSQLGGDDPRARARRAEAAGHLEDATVGYLVAGDREEAARLFVLRAEIAPAPSERLKLLAQAASLAPAPVSRRLVLRRARLELDLAREGVLRRSATELADLGRTLEGYGEPTLAASAFALAGDVEAQAEALVEAGEIDRLEEVLDAERSRARSERRCEQRLRRFGDLVAAGHRREAMSLCDGAAATGNGALAAGRREVRALRAAGPRATLTVDGVRAEVAFGDPVVVGRAGATITVSSPAVSRDHLAVRRGRDGPEVADLGSRNGTTLGGARLESPVRVGSGVVVELGGEVAVGVRPAAQGVAISIGDRRIHAPLGPLVVGSWRVEPAEDGWLELNAEPAAHVVLGDLRVEPPIQLCRGDEIRESVGGPVRIRVGS